MSANSYDPIRQRDTFEFPVVGAQYQPGGLDLSYKLKVGEILTLVADGNNPKHNDPDAIQVQARGEVIGYVPNRGNSCTICFSHVGNIDNFCRHCNATPEYFTNNGKSGMAWRLNRLKVFERGQICTVLAVDGLEPVIPVKAELILEGI